jgi:predicted transcriptional regulator YheO
VRPLAEALGAELIEAADARPGDVPLRWDGMVVAAARMPDRVSSIHGALAQLIADVEREMGGALAEMSRADKQRAARMLYDRGAFALRNAADEVADAMGVSRVTIYNYLNAVRST